MEIVLIVSIIGITIMYISEKVADIFKTKYENIDKEIKKNKNCKIEITEHNSYEKDDTEKN